MDVFEKYLTFPGKTDPPLSIFEHSLYVLQVVNYLIEQNAAVVQNPRLVRAGALCHDAGKIAGDLNLKAGKWIHTPHTSQFLGELLGDPRMRDLLATADAVVTDSERDILLKVCETHHYHSPDLLRHYKEVVLVPMADVLASAICAGVVGSIAGILETSPYLEVSLALVRGLGFANGFDGEVHHVDLPGQFVQDVLLSDMIFRQLRGVFSDGGITPLMQRGSSLWVVGNHDRVREILGSTTTNPVELFERAFDEHIYDAILSELPPLGSMQIDSLKYVLVNEAIARKLAISLLTRESIRKVLDRRNLSHLAESAATLLASGLAPGIEQLWNPIRSKLLELLPALDVTPTIADRVPLVANGSLDRFEIGLYAKPGSRIRAERLSQASRNNRDVLAKADAAVRDDVVELLKLFDASGNYNRSLTNVLLEFLKIRAAIAAGDYSLQLAGVALVDGTPLAPPPEVDNSGLCPVCRRFRIALAAQGLITGNPKTDSVFQTFRSLRTQIRVCAWCFLAGYVDLPLATITKDGQSISKGRDYLLLTSPLPQQKLQWLIDFIQRGAAVVQEDDVEVEPEQNSLDASELADLEAMMGGGGGYDQLAVLAMSRRRLAHVKGFVLPTGKAVGNLMGIRVPAERFVGGRDPKVSGAVRRELVKATMYDLHRVTRAPSMHFGTVVPDCAFSVAGKPINIEEMRRANVAYRIADKYARFGRYRQLDSGLFMLLLSNPREAVTQMLRHEARGHYVPGEGKIRRVIEMAEGIADKDWKFDLGLRITSVLVEVDLLPKARSFWKSRQAQFSGVELTKWLQRLKVARDESTLRQWATQLINAMKAGRVASREFKEARGIGIRPPGEKTIGKIIDLTEEILRECQSHNCRLSDFSRGVANMDYYLLFHHNQQAKEVGR